MHGGLVLLVLVVPLVVVGMNRGRQPAPPTPKLDVHSLVSRVPGLVSRVSCLVSDFFCLLSLVSCGLFLVICLLSHVLCPL